MTTPNDTLKRPENAVNPTRAPFDFVIDAHDQTLNLERNQSMGIRMWHLLVSARSQCKLHGLDPDVIWNEAREAETE
jgi:hypothetical protein